MYLKFEEVTEMSKSTNNIPIQKILKYNLKEDKKYKHFKKYQNAKKYHK